MVSSTKLPVHRQKSEDEIDALKTRVIELEARILMMSTVQNNLRGGLKQLDEENAQIRRRCSCYRLDSEAGS